MDHERTVVVRRCGDGGGDSAAHQLLTGARLGEVHVPLSGQALALLVAILEASDPETPYLFPGNVPGQPLKGIKTFWASARRQAGIENYRRHDNRHTYASHLVSSGLSLELVGRLLGHTTATTTKRYAHLADDPLRAATERFGAKIEAFRVSDSVAMEKPWPAETFHPARRHH